ncbi:MAG: DUF1127 domain-containing protein [Proteobacteria bacterium]|nr:DUF1127 domain-containing protein [Pseudomonadota bacterium]
MKDKAFTHANDDAPSQNGSLNYDERWKIVQAARREQSEVFAALVGQGTRNVVRFLNRIIVAPLADIARYAREAALLARLSDHELADIGLSRFAVTGQIFSTGDNRAIANAHAYKQTNNTGARAETVKHDLAA